MNRKSITWSIISLALIMGVLTFVWFRFFYVPNFPEGVLSESKTYLINPETIIDSLDQGEKEVFLSAPPEHGDGWPRLWPRGSFAWDQKDYLKIADALHQFVWKESLEDWHLIRASFHIDQCEDIISKIDFAEFSFYQRREGWNYVHVAVRQVSADDSGRKISAR